MSHPPFVKLVHTLCDSVTRDQRQSSDNSRGNYLIAPEHIIASGLRFMGGSHHKDVADLIGVATRTAERMVEMFLLAAAKRIPNSILKDQHELCTRPEEWDELSSTHGLRSAVLLVPSMAGCCAASASPASPVLSIAEVATARDMVSMCRQCV